MRTIREVKMLGKVLIQSGKTTDAHGEEIDGDDEYIVKFYANNTMTALTQKQWDIRYTYDFTRQVYNADGILNMDIAKIVSFDKEKLTEILLVHISHLNEVEDYEKSKYLYEQVKIVEAHE